MKHLLVFRLPCESNTLIDQSFRIQYVTVKFYSSLCEGYNLISKNIRPVSIKEYVDRCLRIYDVRNLAYLLNERHQYYRNFMIFQVRVAQVSQTSHRHRPASSEGRMDPISEAAHYHNNIFSAILYHLFMSRFIKCPGSSFYKDCALSLCMLSYCRNKYTFLMLFIYHARASCRVFHLVLYILLQSLFNVAVSRL